MQHHSMTKEQRETLNQDLATIMLDLSVIAALLNDCYGSKDPRAVRAEEAHAALQRLQWAMERQGLSLTVANGSARVREVVDTDVNAQE